MNSLFSNVGGKIKAVAKTMYVIETVAAIIAAIALIAAGDDFAGFAVLSAILGPMVALVSAWILYGFGEIVENATNSNARNVNTYYMPPKPVSAPEPVVAPQVAPSTPAQKTAPAAPVVEKKPEVKIEPLSEADIAAGFWLCECGTKNKTMMCMNCGGFKK